MHGFELRWCLLIRKSFVSYKSVLEMKLFEEPDDSLGTRSFEPMECDVDRRCHNNDRLWGALQMRVLRSINFVPPGKSP